MSGPTQRRNAAVSNGHSSSNGGIAIPDGSSALVTNGVSFEKNAIRQRRRTRRLRRKRSSGLSPNDAWEYIGSSDRLQITIAGAVLVLLTLATVYKMAFSGSFSTPLIVDDDGAARAGGERRRNSSPLDLPQHRRKKHKKPAVERDNEGFFASLTSKQKTNYVIPDSLPDYGDKTQRYLSLREEYDALLPPDPDRSAQFVKSLHKHTYKPLHHDTMPYDIYNCPDYPPRRYPIQWNIMEVLKHWNPDDATPPTDLTIHQGLCVFDFEKDFEKALNYREAELPFVIRNDPEVYRTTERWNQPEYMEKLMDNVRHRTEFSPNNHFMYWMAPGAGKRKKNGNGMRKPVRGPTGKKIPAGWEPPTQMMRMSYKEWLSHANTTDDNLGPDKPHWYYRLIGCGNLGQNCDKGSSEYLYDELTFFQPVEDKFHVVEPDEQKGIHCRFGMKGVIAENHFDSSRNAIVLLGGERRYILAHPNQCKKLSLLPKDHPSGRHSAVDWSDPDLITYPEFAYATANEVVLQAGDVLYLPTFWFHYIISLELNFQCNQRSGVGLETKGWITDCGF